MAMSRRRQQELPADARMGPACNVAEPWRHLGGWPSLKTPVLSFGSNTDQGVVMRSKEGMSWYSIIAKLSAASKIPNAKRQPYAGSERSRKPAFASPEFVKNDQDVKLRHRTHSRGGITVPLPVHVRHLIDLVAQLGQVLVEVFL